VVGGTARYIMKDQHLLLAIGVQKAVVELESFGNVTNLSAFARQIPTQPSDHCSTPSTRDDDLKDKDSECYESTVSLLVSHWETRLTSC